MEHIPSNMRIASAKMSNYNRNRFRLETVSSDTAGPNRVVSVNLPEGGALVDAKSFKMHFDVTTTSVTTGSATVAARLPADASSLISRVEIYINGVQINQGAAEYGTIARILKIGRCSRDKDGSIDRALHHGAVDPTDGVETVSLVMSDFLGLLGESSCRFIPTDLVGQVQVRLTFAGNEVLVPKESTVAVGTHFWSADARTSAAAVSYSVSNIFFTCDSIQVDDMYHKMLRQRLSEEEFIPIRYKEYYQFSLDNISTPSHTTRFSLSSSSIDKIYATFRDSNHQTAGIKGHQMDATFTDNLCSNALRFRSFDSETTREGTMRYQFSVNNVAHPQYRAGTRDALFDNAYVNDKVHDASQGNLITSLAQFNDGLFVIPLILNHPGEPIAVRSGLNSKGISTMLSLSVSGQVMPTVNADAQTTASISSFIVAETTAELRVGLGRTTAIDF